MREGLGVCTARVDEGPVLARVLAHAFRGDPVVGWLCPDRARRPALFRLLVQDHHAASGCADLALLGGEPVGAALWDPPGHRLSRTQQLLRHRVDKVSGPAYLESSNEANLPLYARQRFVARAPDRLPFGGPPFWPMDRPAS